MECLKTVKRDIFSKDQSGWNFTIKPDGKIYGSIHYKGVVHGFELQEEPELFLELNTTLHLIPCIEGIDTESVLVIGYQSKDKYFVALDDCKNYSENSPEASLWQHLESLASRIIKKKFGT